MSPDMTVHSRPDGGAGTGWSTASGVWGTGWGLTLLVAGPRLWHGLTGTDAGRGDRAAIRALGARHLGQGVVQLVAPSRFTRTLTVVETVHAATMAGLATVDPGRRRPALLSAAVATGTAATLLTRTIRRHTSGPVVS